ncbi:hypothetical protein N9O93_01110 [bacterium]|jgi:hypothetical protein|nr:hypothetical protein [Hellea sp.]MDA9047665.1 hypothetical protein [Hellea sp.]MDA9225270.1 hypothetical protein [bacterium]
MTEIKKKTIQQDQEVELVTVSLWAKIKHWWRTLVREEWEITIYFIGEVKFFEDGSRVNNYAPKTYRAKAIKKLTQTHIIFVDLLGIKHEIKVVEPVGYDVRKIY